MNSVKETETLNEIDALSAVSGCLEKIGSTEFNKAFIDLATGPLGADQCMVFSYGPRRPRCFLSYNDRPKGHARCLAAKYILHGYISDPIQAYMQTIPEPSGIEIVPLDALRGDMSDEYWKEYFEAPGLVDKIDVLASQNGLHLSFNFYRYEESGPYGTAIRKRFETLGKVAAQLALLHYQSSVDHALEDPLQTLSEREQEVCRWILKGLTTDAIANEMDVSANTIATFRKRAYDKLSINSKTALFALCRQ
ncbi:helix-turn-helix transcriptional regulator [Neptunomonas qingdaonensis]|uniref:Regulatory protein, luxR family n=1 Tax=Neptunomonas qingdaonensis TaxID=1045558 RepID=A0A1I2QXQ2_9GAMM|nr:helix-turn-helix transcriptional regulator [Neptunomonas qingdaonensis]SFG32493.1 regulatory protein, luxR family [Neptunomonas qingdaonensis]